MNVSVLEFVEHRLHGAIVKRQRLTHTGRQTGIVHQFAQALLREREVVAIVVDGVVVSRRRLFLPGPSWQCGERPLQYAH